jgi:protein-tyrosine phosphatase
VCTGGHCRAPLAAAVLAHHGRNAVETRAAALRNWHIGEGAHRVMAEVAARHGYDLSSYRGTVVGPDLLAWADIVLAMDAAVFDALRDLAGQSNTAKLRLYLEAGDVPDPWRQPASAFTACLSVVEAGAQLHLADW